MTGLWTPRILARGQGPAANEAGSSPRVDVVIPNYNYGRFVEQALDSVLTQEGVLVRAIVVDDASTDDSVDRVRAIAKGDDRVLLVQHAVNKGPVATFNDGLEQVDAEYLVRLDADDMLTPGSLARSTWLAERHPGVGLVYGHPIHFAGEAPRARTGVDGYTVWSGSSWLELRCRLGVNCITSPEVLMRRSVVDEVGGQRDLAHTHDMEMWFRIARASDVGHLSGCDQAWHREHGDSLSAREVDVMTDLEEREAAFRTLFEASPHAEDARLWRIARTALAAEAGTRTASAYLRGRGGTPETDEYLRYARDVQPPGTTPYSLRRAERAVSGTLPLGRADPALFVLAAKEKIVRGIRARRWRATGL
ncbi:glycosyltransferase family 2 protein [Microbacterium sp. NPDC057650]|uniref:glycosyltransferase family 2 protein n=1 Tax=unclassified Microbacterium TaxID=2609290 RepID=UPI00366E4E6B